MNEKEQLIKDTNEWALKVGDAIFNKEYYKLRQVLTDDTWKLIVSNLNITDPADKRFKMIPTKFLEQAMQGSVRKAMNDEGVKLGLASTLGPAAMAFGLEAAGAPIVQRGLLLAGLYGKQGLNWLSQQADKAFPWIEKNILPTLNKLDPTSKEFAAMGLAGKLGVGTLESAGLYEAGKSVHDFVLNPSLLKVPETVISASAALPYVGAAGKITQPSVLNAVKQGKKVTREVNKYFTAEQRYKNLINKISKSLLLDYQTELAVISQRGLEQDLLLDLAVKIPSLERELNAFNLNDLHIPNFTETGKKFTATHIDDRWRRFKSAEKYYSKDLHITHLPDIDLSKLKEDDVYAVLAKYYLRDKTKIAEAKKFLADQNIRIIKLNGDWFFEQDGVILDNVSNYNPYLYVDTNYEIYNYKDLEQDPIIGSIKFPTSTQKGTVSVNSKTKNSEYKNVEITDPGFEETYIGDDYLNMLSSNIEDVQQRLPGFVPFGSSAGVSKARFPHATHDIDGYMTYDDFMLWRLRNPDIPGAWRDGLKDITWRAKMYDLPGEHGDIDINIINTDENGFVIGERAEELIRILFPKEYTNHIINNLPLKITSKQLFDALKENYAPKSIADVFEIYPAGNKSKQLGRPLVYLSSADPTEVRKGLLMHAMAFGATDMFPASLEELSDVLLNIRILQELDIPVSIKEVARDPQKMKNVLDYWYLQYSVRGRGVGGVTLPEDIIASLTEAWDPLKNRGGIANGAGRNTVLFGKSGDYPYYGYILLRPNRTYENEHILNRISLIKRDLGYPGHIYSDEDILSIKKLAKEFGVKLSDFKTSDELLNSLNNKDKETSLFLKALDERLGIKSLTRNEKTGYGESVYSSVTGDTNGDNLVVLGSNSKHPLHIAKRKAMLSYGLFDKSIQYLLDMINGISLSRILMSNNYRRNLDLDQPIPIEISKRTQNVQSLKRRGLYDEFFSDKKKAEEKLEQTKKEKDIHRLVYDAYTKTIEKIRKNIDINEKRKTELEHKKYRINDIKNNINTSKMLLGTGIPFSSFLGYSIYKSKKNEENYKQDLLKLSDDLLIYKYKNLSSNGENRFAKDYLEEIQRRGIKLLFGGTINYLNLFK